MSKQYDKLIDLLQEMFQFNQADLDFGIYRIMNQKRDEINQFLNHDLLPQVKQSLQKYQPADQAAIKKELEDMKSTLEKAGVIAEETTGYKALQERLEKAVDVTSIENEIYSDLTNFFSRYYNEGDFLSLRRYKKGVYAIPYEGEEVKLHWANADQYYIKTSEDFHDYSFTLLSGKRAHFKLVEASTEQNNNKALEGKERRFILVEDHPLVEDQGELFIRFEYRPHEGGLKQDALNQQAVERILSSSGYTSWIEELSTLNPTEKNKKRTLLEKHLNDYTAKNTFDYFIHKDLGNFLRRELDFYIKNEIMYIDDLDTENEVKIEQYLSKIRIIKSIGHKIIAFLEQIENFQKKLFLKKKFVVQTDYCITLDRVPKELYPQIIDNQEQVEEWKRLFAIDEIVGDTTTPAYSEPLTITFLEANPYLVLDTKFFNASFKDQLLAVIENLDKQLDGLLINSENFQALSLLQEKYKKHIRSVYIDPPYNTVHSEIVYKNQYKHSSWLSLMANVGYLTFPLFEKTFSFGIAIDDYEFVKLASLYDSMFPNLSRDVVIVNHHPQGAGGRLSRTHEYFILYSPDSSPAYLGKPLEDYKEDRTFMRSGTAENNFRTGRWKSFYALIIDPKTNEVIEAEPPVPLGEEYPICDTPEGYKRVYPINSKGEERVWRSSYETGKIRVLNHELAISDRGTVYQKIDHESKRETLFSNWTDSKFNAGVHGTNLIRDMGFGGLFDYPKSINTVETALWAQTYGDSESIILDYFAGSGTTGHAVINLNREDSGTRRYILVEMGQYFDTVTKPRIQKVIYSKDWKDGKPVSREGSSHMFKYIRLESYEDTLNNLELKRDTIQGTFLDVNPDAREEYLLSYMLDIESRENLLNIDAFRNPFDYKLKITNGTEYKYETVDMVETFNYLIGLHVEHIDMIRGNKIIKGTLRNGDRALIIWRNIDEVNNEQLDRFFKTLNVSTKDFEFDRIYVNGDNNLENLKVDEDRWKVVLIEEEFTRLMFDVQDV